MKNVETWDEIKAVLFAYDTLNLKPLVEPFLKSVDVIVLETLRNIDLTPPEYDPFLIEAHLSDAARLLDNCLAYRREINDLEVLAVKQALDYKLFQDSLKIERDLLAAQIRKDQFQIETTAQEQVSKEFSEVSTDNALGKGLSIQADGASRSAKTSLDQEKNRERLLNERLDLMTKYQVELNSRHNAPGNGLNFRERRERLTLLFVSDLSEAYKKSFSASLALIKVLGVSTSNFEKVTIATSGNYLDRLVHWVRESMRKTEISAEKEIEYDRIIRLAYPLQETGTALVPNLETEMKDTGDGEVRFRLTADFFPTQEHVRLRGVGLSYGTNWKNLEDVSNKQHMHYCARINMPAQELPGLDSPVPRPEIFLGSVGVFSPAVTVNLMTGAACNDISPIGDWRILVDKIGFYVDGAATRVKAPIKDLFLHLRLVAKTKVVTS